MGRRIPFGRHLPGRIANASIQMEASSRNLVNRRINNGLTDDVNASALNSPRFLGSPDQIFQLPRQRAARYLRRGKALGNELLFDFRNGDKLAGPGHFECAFKGCKTIVHGLRYHGLPTMCVFKAVAARPRAGQQGKARDSIQPAAQNQFDGLPLIAIRR